MPTIILAQEDAEAREIFTALLLDFFPTANLQTAKSWPDLEPLLAGTPHATTLLSDVLWEGEDRSWELLLMAERFSRIPFAVFARYDLSGTLPAGYPIPLLSPDEQLPLRLAEIMENFSGGELGPYVISAPAGPHILGRLYWANHHQLQRSVHVLIPPSGSPLFPKAIRAMARVNHPSVYALYESIPWKNRIVVIQEPVAYPSLLHLRLSGNNPGLLSCARLATTLGSVLAEMESSSVPARLLGEYDYTVSPKGIPRLRNPAAYPSQPETSAYENARHLAGFLEPLLLSQPKAAPLLHILRNPGPSAFDLLRQTSDFERQLAEVRRVHVRQEEIEAAAKTLKARIIRRWTIGAASFLTAGFLFLSASVIRDAQTDLPARVRNRLLPVPRGEVRIGEKSLSVPAFQMDEFEVTMGEYEVFLKTIKNIPSEEFRVLLPQGSSKTKWQDLIPRGWNFEPGWLSRLIIRRDLYGSAIRGGTFEGTAVSRDTPVTGVDFDCAFAYARSAKRFLPTREQFLRAALGDHSHAYPYHQLNVGIGISSASASRVDHFGALPVGSVQVDQGPYQHKDLAGNVSEWIQPPSGQNPLLMGANFAETNPDNLRINAVYSREPDARDYRIGFRTVDSRPSEDGQREPK